MEPMRNARAEGIVEIETRSHATGIYAVGTHASGTHAVGTHASWRKPSGMH